MLSFDEAVERIKALEQDLQHREALTRFEQGDLALEQCAIGKESAHNDRDEILGRLALQSEVGVEALKQRRFVASRIPAGIRIPAVPWSGWLLVASVSDEPRRHEILQRLQTEDFPEKVKDGEKYTRWSTNAIRALLDKSPTWAADAVTAIEFASPTEKVEVFQALTQDEHIVTEASDYTTPTAEALGKLEVASSHLAQQRTDEHYAHDPVFQAHDARVALLDLAAALRVFAENIETILPRLRDLPQTADPRGHDIFLTAALERAQEAMLQATQFIETGQTDIDAFLGEVLGSEGRG